MMDQFYVSRHAGGVTYLCLRDEDNPWYGHSIKRLDTPEPPPPPPDNIIGRAKLVKGWTPTWPSRKVYYWDCSEFGFGRVRVPGGPGGAMLDDTRMLDLQSGAIIFRNIKQES
jgi:hypothetical protein